jgi:DNA replication protein DnaC
LTAAAQRQSRHSTPASRIENTRMSLASIPGMTQMPAHLRDLAAGTRPLTSDELQATEESFARCDQEQFEEALHRREAGREKLWLRRCPRKYRTASLDDLHPQQDPQGKHLTSRTDISNAVTTWLDGQHQGLLMRGPSRHGKSYAAFAIAHAARARGAYVSAWSLPVLNKALRGSLGQKEEDAAWTEVLDSDVLLIDDVGQENITDWTKEQLYIIAEYRLTNENRRNLITTNFGYTELVDLYGDPLVERLLEDTVICVVQGQKLAAYEADPF